MGPGMSVELVRERQFICRFTSAWRLGLLTEKRPSHARMVLLATSNRKTEAEMKW